MEVIDFQRSGNESRIQSIYSEAAGRPTSHRANTYVLATGGILGGGIQTNHTGSTFEPIFDLAIQPPLEISEWVQRDFLHPDGHPIFSAGIRTNEDFKTDYENLYAIGGTLFGDFVRERSLSGISLASGFHVAEVLS